MDGGCGAQPGTEEDMRRLAILYVFIALTFAACGRAPDSEFDSLTVQNVSLWNHRAEGDRWTKAAMTALDTHGAVLVHTVPEDIDAYCPGYEDAGPAGRKGFWVTFLSALAKHESTWAADASGGGGQWLGLLQISPQTAHGYGCQAQTAEELKKGGKNLSCAVRIMAVTVPRDGVISEGMRGVAADWGPFHQAEKRADIQATTRAFSGCRS